MYVPKDLILGEIAPKKNGLLFSLKTKVKNVVVSSYPIIGVYEGVAARIYEEKNNNKTLRKFWRDT